MGERADFRDENRDGRQTLTFVGDLRLPYLGDMPKQLALVEQVDMIDLSDVARIDTVGAWIIHRLKVDKDATLTGANDDVAALIDQVAQSDKTVRMRPDRITPLFRVLGEIGAAVVVAGHNLKGLLGFFGAVMIEIGRASCRERV